MPSESEQAVAAYFHAKRSLLKKDRLQPQVDRVQAAMERRAREEEAERRRLEEDAERALWEANRD